MNSTERKASILNAAAKVFVAQGFEPATLTTIAQASGAAIGSITHFFNDKVGLGEAVRDAAMARLAALVAKALESPGHNVTASLHAAVTGYLHWAREHPADVRVLQELASVKSKRHRPGAVHQRLLDALARWAAPHIQTRTLPPISPAGLYAIILAPVASLALASVDGNNEEISEPVQSMDWPGVLAHGAVEALRFPARSSHSKPRQPEEAAKPTKSRRPGQGHLPI